MTDTVTRLMQLAGEWADQVGNISDPLNTHQEWELSVRKAKLAKQALHDELVRLFTPLTHEQAKLLVMTYSNDPLNLIFQTEVIHGIGGES